MMLIMLAALVVATFVTFLVRMVVKAAIAPVVQSYDKEWAALGLRTEKDRIGDLADVTCAALTARGGRN